MGNAHQWGKIHKKQSPLAGDRAFGLNGKGFRLYNGCFQTENTMSML